MLDRLARGPSVTAGRRRQLVVDINGTARSEVVADAGAGRRRRGPGGAAAAPGGRVPRPGRRRTLEEAETGDGDSSPDAAGDTDRPVRPGYRPRPPCRSRRSSAGRRAGGVPSWRSGFMVLLPLIILVAFEFDVGRRRRQRRAASSPAWSTWPPRGGLNFALFTLLRVGVVPAGRGGRAVLRRHGGQRGELGQPALPAGDPGAAGPAARREAGGRARVLGAGAAAAGRHRAAGRHLRYGWQPLRSTVAAELGPGRGRCCGCSAVLGYLAVVLLVVAGLAFLLSVSTDARSARSAARCCCGSCPASWTRSPRWARCATSCRPTTATPGWGCSPRPMQTDDVVRGCISAISYATLFWGLAFWRFTRKDITS